MFEYLAEQDIVDLEAEVERPPLIVFPVLSDPPPERIYDPVLVDGSVMSGCWRLEHWDSNENVGVYNLSDDEPVAMTFDEASRYLAFDS
jgi:hypothetical protein